MSLSYESSARLQKLQKVQAFAGVSDNTLRVLAEISEEVTLKQGQTLLRSGVMETHCFVILQGSLRLLAKDPVSKDLFTVGRCDPGELVGIVNLLRQGSCEAAIARQPCQLLSLPLSKIFEAILNDRSFLQILNQQNSPCEGVAVLSPVLAQLNPPPADSQAWLLDKFKPKQLANHRVNVYSALYCLVQKVWLKRNR